MSTENYMYGKLELPVSDSEDSHLKENIRLKAELESRDSEIEYLQEELTSAHIEIQDINHDLTNALAEIDEAYNQGVADSI